MNTSNSNQIKHRLEPEPTDLPQSHNSLLSPLQEILSYLCDDKTFWIFFIGLTHIYISKYIIWFTFKYYVNGVLHNVLYSVLPLLLYIILDSSLGLHIVHLFIFTEYCTTLYRGKNFIYCTADRHWSCFNFLAIIKMKMVLCTFLQT